MTVTDFMLIFVIAAIAGVTLGLIGIRKAIDDLASEIRQSRKDELQSDEEPS